MKPPKLLNNVLRFWKLIVCIDHYYCHETSQFHVWISFPISKLGFIICFVFCQLFIVFCICSCSNESVFQYLFLFSLSKPNFWLAGSSHFSARLPVRTQSMRERESSCSRCCHGDALVSNLSEAKRCERITNAKASGVTSDEKEDRRQKVARNDERELMANIHLNFEGQRNTDNGIRQCNNMNYKNGKKIVKKRISVLST